MAKSDIMEEYPVSFSSFGGASHRREETIPERFRGGDLRSESAVDADTQEQTHETELRKTRNQSDGPSARARISI